MGQNPDGSGPSIHSPQPLQWVWDRLAVAFRSHLPLLCTLPLLRSGALPTAHVSSGCPPGRVAATRVSLGKAGRRCHPGLASVPQGAPGLTRTLRAPHTCPEEQALGSQKTEKTAPRRTDGLRSAGAAGGRFQSPAVSVPLLATRWRCEQGFPRGPFLR